MAALSSARVGERPLQFGDLDEDRVDRVAHPEAEIDRDLVVARARGVQAPGRRADDLGKPAFDVHMDVFERALERERSRLDFAFDLRKTLGDRLGVGGFDDALARRAWRYGPAEPAMSWAASLRSKSIEALISSIASAGRPANRPPHIVLLMRVVPDEVDMTNIDKASRAGDVFFCLFWARCRGGRGWRRPIRDGRAGRQGRERLPGRLGQARGDARAARQGRTGGAPGGERAPAARSRSPSSATTAAKLTLADFKGRAVLLNLWATWCVPCRAEMPALDRLQAAKGGPGFRGGGGECRHRAARAAGRLSGQHRRQVADPLRRSERRRLRDPAQGRQGARPAGDPGHRQETAANSAAVEGGAKWDSAEAQALVAALKGG